MSAHKGNTYGVQKMGHTHLYCLVKVRPSERHSRQCELCPSNASIWIKELRVNVLEYILAATFVLLAGQNREADPELYDPEQSW